MNCPAELLYAPSHEWVRMDENTAVVGVTEHAQRELTDVVYVELPGIGKHFDASQPICVVESVKAASDIYAPVSGTVESVNTELTGNPALINTDPYGAGWIFTMRVDSSADLSRLMSATDYEKQLPSESP